jgi:ribosome-binding factor A
MATNRRVSRVAELIRREVSQMLLSDIKDDRVGAGMVSVTDVDVSGDLQHAKVYVSIYGTDEAKAETMAGLKSATGYVRREIGARVRLRRTPELIFLEDISIERGTKVLSLLNQLNISDSESVEGSVEGVGLPPSNLMLDEAPLEEYPEGDELGENSQDS